MWKIYECWTKSFNAITFQNIKCHMSRSLEDSGSESNVDYGGLAQEASEGSQDFHSYSGRSLAVTVWQRIMAVLCLCLENLPKVKIKKKQTIFFW